MQIEQVYFSKSVKYFEKMFLDRWGLKPYSDPSKPALFKGVYNPRDVKVINSHESFGVIWHTGRTRRHMLSVKPREGLVVRLCPISVSDRKHNPTEYNEYYFNAFRTKYANFPLKDWSDYKPVPLGNKLYIYLGSEKGKWVMGYKELEEIFQDLEVEVIIGFREEHDPLWLRDNHYKDTLINFKPSITGGYATATELACMGRYTISNAWGPFCKPYSSSQDILDIVKDEMKHIGQTRGSVLGDYYDTGDEWMNVDFWLYD